MNNITGSFSCDVEGTGLFCLFSVKCAPSVGGLTLLSDLFSKAFAYLKNKKKYIIINILSEFKLLN